MLRYLLAALIVYIPYQLRLPSDIGVKGLNGFNLLLLLALILLAQEPNRAQHQAPLRGRIAFFCLTLGVAFAFGQMHPLARPIDDLTDLKIALTYVLLYFLVFHAADDADTIRFLFCAVLFVVSVAALQGVRQGLDQAGGHYDLAHRISGPFGGDWHNANRAGVFYSVFSPLFLATAFFYRSQAWVPVGGLAVFVLSTAAVFYTYSRQALLIQAISVAVLAVRRSLAVGLIAAAVLGNYQLWAPASVVERLDMTFRLDDEGEEQVEESAESRFIIWSGAFEIIKQHPLGIGFNRFKDEIEAYIGRRMDAHSQYVLIATEMGVQGFLAFVWLLFGFVTLGIRVARRAQTEEERVLGYGYTVASLCLVLGSLYGSPFFFGELIGDFWVLSALVAKYHVLKETAEHDESAVDASAPGA